MQILLFDLDEFRFALPAGTVLELHRAVAIAPLPGAPEGVLGAVNVRGKVLPVLDLRVRIGLAPRAEIPTDVLIRVDTGAAEVLILADHAHALREVGGTLTSSTESAPGVHVGARFTDVDGALVLIAEPAAFLDAPARDLLAAALARLRDEAGASFNKGTSADAATPSGNAQ